MKNRLLLLAACFSSLVVLVVGCKALGSNPTPPTKAESLIFNTVTNYSTVVVPAYVTNQVTVTQTNVLGVTQFLTNVVPVTVPAQTNLVAGYTETLKPSVASSVQSGGGIANLIFPGWGSIGSNIVLLLGGVWAYLRSQKQGQNLATTLAQNIETARQLMQSLPNGANLDAAFVQFIQQHQAESGVLQQVINLIGTKVNNNDAQVAAQQISQTLAALNQATTPPKA